MRRSSEHRCNLEFFSDHFKTEDLCNEAECIKPCLLRHVPKPCLLKYVPDNLRTQEAYSGILEKKIARPSDILRLKIF